MEKITTRAELLDKIKDVMAVEILARNGYDEDTRIFKNQKIVNTLKKIKIDEDEHIKILTELIEMLEKPT